MNSVTLLSGEELRPIQAGEQQSPSAVFYSTTVVGEEARAQQLLQTIVSYSVLISTHSHTLDSHTFSKQCRRGGGDNGRGCW